MELIKAFDNQEPLVEMATVALSSVDSLKIIVTPDRGRVGSPYLKVFNTVKLKPGESKVARLHFFDNKLEYHKDKYLDWCITDRDVRNIQQFLSKAHEDFSEYTNWQMACYLWNLELDLVFNRKDYFSGKYEKDNMSNPSYVPFNTKMPNTWIYDPPKGKNKRK